jgi:arylformamidase
MVFHLKQNLEEKLIANPVQNKMIIPQWRNMTDAARSKAYSPSSALPEGELEQQIRRYIDKSNAAYAAFPNTRTISYGDEASNTIDIVTPAPDKPVPLLVFLHGGYWQQLSKKESFFPATQTLPRGIAFATIDYTLAPVATIDEIVDECCAAVSLLVKDADKLNIDPNRIVLSGSSAGAHLAAMCCLKLPPALAPSGVVLMSGIYELAPLIGTYINDVVGMDLACADRNSPALANLDNFPKSVIAWGRQETDEFKLQSQYFASLLNACSRQVETVEMTLRNHFDIVEDIANNSILGQKMFALLGL